MAKIVQRTWPGADGTTRRGWQIDFIDPDGRRIRKQFQRRKDADDFWWRAGSGAARHLHTRWRVPTVGEAASHGSIAARRRLGAGTLQMYREHKAHLLAVIDGKPKLSRLSPARVRAAARRSVAPALARMARKLLQSFKAVLKDARRRGLIAQNPASETTIDAAARHKAKLKAGRDFPLPAESWRCWMRPTRRRGRWSASRRLPGGGRPSFGRWTGRTKSWQQPHGDDRAAGGQVVDDRVAEVGIG